MKYFLSSKYPKSFLPLKDVEIWDSYKTKPRPRNIYRQDYMPPAPASDHDIEDKLYTDNFMHFMSDTEIHDQAKNFWTNHRFEDICCDCEEDVCSYQYLSYNSNTTELAIEVDCQKSGKQYIVTLNKNPGILFNCDTVDHYKNNCFSIAAPGDNQIPGSILLSKNNPTLLSEIELRFWWWVAQRYADIPEWMIQYGLEEEIEEEETETISTSQQPQQPQAVANGDLIAGDGTNHFQRDFSTTLWDSVNIMFGYDNFALPTNTDKSPDTETYISPFDGSEK